MVTAQPEQIHGAVQWIQDELKPTNVGLMGLAADFGKDALPRFKAPLEKGGVKIVNERLYPQGTADLTNEMLAMKGSDLVVNWASRRTLRSRSRRPCRWTSARCRCSAPGRRRSSTR